MAFPRFTAVAFLIFLIGSLSLLCIGLVALRQSAMSISTDQHNIESVQGKIVSLGPEGPDMDFILETATGQYLHFRCASSCHTSLAHLQRHLYEQATTVVYYVEEPKTHLLALNVD